MLLAGLVGCSDKDDSPIQLNELEYGAQTALNLVNSFRERITSADMSRASLTNLKIIDCKREDVILHKVNADANSSSLSRVVSDETENVELYNFKFEIDGKVGFAYSSPDPRVNRVLAYCENGSIADTVDIGPMAMAIRGISRSCAYDLDEYYSGEKDLSRAGDNPTVWGPLLTTEWSQQPPYNNDCGGSGCSKTINGKYPAGCVAIAIGQSVAFVNRHTSQFNLTALRKEKSISMLDPLAAEVAAYIHHVGVGCQMKYDCDGSSSTLKLGKNYLVNIGYRDGKDFEYAQTNSFNMEKLGMALLQSMPVCVGGITDSGKGHAWIFEGISAQVQDYLIPKKVYALYCNWGQGGTGNGWYPDGTWYTPINQTTFKPMSDGPYYRNNEFIYFKYTRR